MIYCSIESGIAKKGALLPIFFFYTLSVAMT